VFHVFPDIHHFSCLPTVCSTFSFLRREVQIAVNIKIGLPWDVMSCSLVSR
jgi:hypothetical protein